MELSDYVELLYSSDNFSRAFQVFESEVQSLGFDGVLYTYIPRMVVDQSLQPVYQVSGDYSPGYLEHYADARFDLNDPLIKAVNAGETTPVSWWGPVCRKYMGGCGEGKNVIETARQYGINNGVTLPLLSGACGISGASFISEEKNDLFARLLSEQLEPLTLRTRLFHNMVLANAQFSVEFVKPLMDSLNDTEKQFLIGLAAGLAPSQIAAKLNSTDKYLEQVMLRIRRKLSGVGPDESPAINRNQVLYYAGLMGVLEYPDEHRNGAH